MSIASELKELIGMLENGYITRAQFDVERDKLMSNSTSGSQPGIGKSLGAYNILDEVGRGGMGVVYRARHRSSQIAMRQGGDVAVKVLHAQYSQDPTFQERFEREATLGLKLNHDGIVKVHDLIVAEGGRLALAMELVKGQELSNLIGKVRGPIPWREALAMFDGLLDAVSHAHREGVIHRDLKPDNIMVCEGGELKVLDFGIAKDEKSSGGTKDGTGMGTIDYMAPEQHRDASKVDARADIYALGMTLYEMVAGRLPWAPEAGEFDVMSAKMAGNLPPPTQFYPDIPPELVKVLVDALQVDVGSRCSSADAFRSALKGVIRSAGTVSPEDEEEARKAKEVRKARVEVLRKVRESLAAKKASSEPSQEVGERLEPVASFEWIGAEEGVALMWLGVCGIFIFLFFIFNSNWDDIACTDGEGCVNLGVNYAQGLGVGKDDSKAFKYYEKACSLDSGYGCASLGYSYDIGRGVGKDDSKAFKYYEKACSLDNGYGCASLGYSYDIGLGVGKDASKAASLYKKACALGYEEACSY